MVAGLCALFMRPGRLIRSAIVTVSLSFVFADEQVEGAGKAASLKTRPG
jgi:hypothetical protein